MGKIILIKDNSFKENALLKRVLIFVETPIINIEEGVLSLHCNTNNTSIYYTIDDTTPTESSMLYTEPVELEDSCIVKAIAIKNGQASLVASAIYSKPSGNNIQFKDALLKSILVADTTNVNKDGDLEISYEEASACTSLPTLKGNTEITSFDEFEYFTGIKQIGIDTFRGCTSLDSIVLPTSITLFVRDTKATDEGAFSGCTSLKSITIPDNVTLNCKSTFVNCTSLETAVFGKHTSGAPENMFKGCSKLKNVTFDIWTVNSGAGMFQNCTSLESIVLPDDMTSIATNMFNGCTSLKNIHLPMACKTIGNSAFTRAAISDIEIPAACTKIETNAFSYTSLGKVIFRGTTPPSIASGAFWGGTYYVPDESVEAYSAILSNVHPLSELE